MEAIWRPYSSLALALFLASCHFERVMRAVHLDRLRLYEIPQSREIDALVTDCDMRLLQTAFTKPLRLGAQDDVMQVRSRFLSLFSPPFATPRRALAASCPKTPSTFAKVRTAGLCA